MATYFCFGCAAKVIIKSLNNLRIGVKVIYLICFTTSVVSGDTVRRLNCYIRDGDFNINLQHELFF